MPLWNQVCALGGEWFFAEPLPVGLWVVAPVTVHSPHGPEVWEWSRLRGSESRGTEAHHTLLFPGLLGTFHSLGVC